MTIQENALLLSEVMGFQTKSTTLYLDALRQVAVNCNIPFNKTAPDYINIKEDLDRHYANCVNHYNVQINSLTMSSSTFTARQRLAQNAEYIEELASKFIPNLAPKEIGKIQDKLDQAYAVEAYLSNLPQDALCDENDLMEIALAVEYGIDFEESCPDFEGMRQQMVHYAEMVDYLKKELIDTDGLSFDEIKELHNDHDGEYNTYPQYHSSHSRMWG